MSVLFVSGIDTDIGKTIATGNLARALYRQNFKVITQKLVQTGCQGIAEDIAHHREIMGIDLQPEDLDLTTCPYVFSKPASPHLSSNLENIKIQPNQITSSTQNLLKKYDVILLEGAGGLLVPITETCLTLDYIAEQGYPVVLVTSGRLGSINHTLLSLEAIKSRALSLFAIVFNHWQPENELVSSYIKDSEINNSTRLYLQDYINNNFPNTHWVDMPNEKKSNDLNQLDKDSQFSFNQLANLIIEYY